MTEYDWLIIGGGPHGRFIAASIARAAREARLAVVDPLPALAAWRARAAACGMRYLRSSNAHHLGARADSLRRFARAAGYDGTHALGYYRRPSLALFDEHAAAELGAPAHVPRRAHRLTRRHGGWRVELDDGDTLTARRVVLATGPGRPYRPAGFEHAEHVFDPDFELGDPGAATVIVGGGITGAQFALRAAEAGRRTCWLTRHRPVRADFDSDPCYAGPRCLAPFVNAPPARRTQMLADARLPGTLPPDIHGAITAALAARRVAWRRGEPERLTPSGVLLADGRLIHAGRVILATGFAHRPDPNSLLGRAVADFDLALDPAGHLYIDAELAAAPGLHIAGRPASLQLRPMAGNIKGARLAGRVLAAIARHAAAAA
ncbi:FAD/NAD(P)-binding protein [Salinisphaera sp.]|uniref:FAD/NAD(P)-binding protein n=1 Tax=Salinisphaera sp. TaxID=1914330 RepID=UPI002D7811A8|nr:FAD/NAD(P)-binding protein [Salinisphaera sp.]HET7313115.1 FAD/NAD(P)-binding protein [Salinisphaera sp.]